MQLFKNLYSHSGAEGAQYVAPEKDIPFFFSLVKGEFFDLILLNFIFLLFCLPVITIPAALSAMNRINLKIIRQEGYILFADFFKAFKTNFLKSLLAGLIVLTVGALLVNAIVFYSSYLAQQGVYIALLAFSATMLAVLIVTSFYIFASISLMDFTLFQTLKNSFFLSIIAFKSNVKALVFFLVVGFVMFAFFPSSVPFVLVGFFSIINLAININVYKNIDKYLIAK